jgi:hypothetical protein
MAAIVKRAFIFTPAFLQENDGNPEFLQDIFRSKDEPLLWNFEGDVGVKASRLANRVYQAKAPLVQSTLAGSNDIISFGSVWVDAAN